MDALTVHVELKDKVCVTCDSIEGCDAEERYHCHVDVPPQSLLDEDGPRKHVHLETAGGWVGEMEDPW